MEIKARIEIENPEQGKLKEVILESFERIRSKYPNEIATKIYFEITFTNDRAKIIEIDEVRT